MLILGEYMRSHLQRLSEMNMPETATVERPVDTPDGQGGFTRTFDVVATVPCRVSISNITPRGDNLQGQPATQTLWTLWFPLGTDVQATDEVVIGERRYHVATVVSARSNEAMLQTIATLIQ